MASGPITSCQTEGKKVEAVTDFLFLGSKITVDGDCSHELRRQLLLGRKAMTNLDNVLKSKEITLLTKVQIVKAIVFPVVIYGCESWTLKKAECQKTDAFFSFIYFSFLFFFSVIFISWRLITLQYCSGFCHTLTWISHGVTCIPHPDPPSHLPLHQSPLGLPSAPGPSTCFKRTASKLPKLLKINDIFNSFPDHHSFFLRHLFIL